MHRGNLGGLGETVATAPVFFSQRSLSQVEMLVQAAMTSNHGDVDDLQRMAGRVGRRPRALSESCLGADDVVTPALIVSNVDGDDDDEEGEQVDEEEEEEDQDDEGEKEAIRGSDLSGALDGLGDPCSCGCGVVPPVTFTRLEEDHEYSEDEGCLDEEEEVTTMIMIEKTEKIVDKGHGTTSEAANSAVAAAAAGDSERRSFSLSVDSGRSSDGSGGRGDGSGGCGGKNSSASSVKSSKFSSYSSEEDDGVEGSGGDSSVKIVPHSFCDFLGSVNRKKSAKHPRKSTKKQSNKVTVFVPYSAISEIRRRESKIRPQQPQQPPVEVFAADNVVICDTQVKFTIIH